MKSYLLACDPFETFLPALDTTVLLAKELLERGIPTDYLDLSQMNYQNSSQEYLSSLKVRSLLDVNTSTQPCFKLGELRKGSINDYAVIFQRKDPPVDESYRGHAQHFAQAPSDLIQINNPKWTPFYSEHLLPQRYPEWAVPTFLMNSLQQWKAWLRSQPGETVAKPGRLFSGKGIEFFMPDTPESELKEFWSRWNTELVVQPFQKAIHDQGDLRILTMNERIVGSVRRLPKPGGRLANLHQGATAHAATPTENQLKAVAEVAKDLNPQGLYLLGLDFIGDALSEVNITCPSAVPQINLFSEVRGEKIIIDETQKLLQRLTC